MRRLPPAILGVAAAAAFLLSGGAVPAQSPAVPAPPERRRQAAQAPSPPASETPSARTPGQPTEAVLSMAVKRRDEYRKSRTSIYMNDFGELGRYRAANARLKAIAVPNRVVFFGDSITDSWPLPTYFPGKPYVNRGIGGQTTPQMLVRFRQDVIDLAPKVVVILAGTNDIAGNTGPMSLEETEANFTTMAELARQHGIRVVFSSILPVHNYTPLSDLMFPLRSPDKILELNRWLKNVASTGGHVYLDYVPAMVDDKGFLKRTLAEDGLHPNRAGYAIMSALAATAIDKALAASAR